MESLIETRDKVKELALGMESILNKKDLAGIIAQIGKLTHTD